MRIAISVEDNAGLESAVSHHFGRCPYYVFVDLEDRQIKQISAVNNPYFGQHSPGQVPAFIRENDVNVMLAGGMGHRAIAFFQQYGIQAVTGASGTVRQALEQYLGGELLGAEPCHDEHGDHHDCG